MRATVMFGAGDVRIEDVPDARLVEPTDAVVRVTRACICGSDLWPYASLEPTETGQRIGHEAIGIVEDVGADVRTVKPGDLVVMPFAFCDGTCAFCRERLHTACVHGGFFDGYGLSAAQAEAVRVPYADGTFYTIPPGEDDALLPSLLTLSDVHGDRPPRRCRRQRRARPPGGGRRRRGGRAVRGHRRETPRRRADPHHGPAGASVVLADINEDALDAATDNFGVVCDATDEDQVAALLERTVAAYGRLDMAFNNAGIMIPPSGLPL